MQTDGTNAYASQTLFAASLLNTSGFPSMFQYTWLHKMEAQTSTSTVGISSVKLESAFLKDRRKYQHSTLLATMGSHAIKTTRYKKKRKKKKKREHAYSARWLFGARETNDIRKVQDSLRNAMLTIKLSCQASHDTCS
jgi:hypothetical protein